MAKMTKPAILGQLLAGAPRYQALIEKGPARYMGPCVVQAPGAWTRIGPTWLIPGVGWLIIGPGVANWGTQKGLAELATDLGPKPTWHAIGLVIAPAPNLVFAVVEEVLRSSAMEEVAALATDAEEYNATRS